MDGRRSIFGILEFFISVHLSFGFMTGAPDWSCKDPSTFHTLRLNASHEGIIMPQDMNTNPYVLETDSTTFAPGSRIIVTIRGATPDVTVNGFFIQAIQAEISIRDLRRQPFGTFENTTINERPSKCQPINGVPRGGATHANSAPKDRARVVWLAPTEYNPGSVQFLATGVSDYSTYWTDIRSPVMTPIGYPSQEETAPFHWTPTASWYRWLQYVQQQQLLMDYITQNSNQGATVSAQSTETKQKQELDVQKKANDQSKANFTPGNIGLSSASLGTQRAELATKTANGMSSKTGRSDSAQITAKLNTHPFSTKFSTTTSKPIVH